MQTVMERSDTRLADPAEALFNEIMAQPVARRLDRVPGEEATPKGVRELETTAVLAYVLYHDWYFSYI